MNYSNLYIISGLPKSGKSTLISRLLKKLIEFNENSESSIHIMFGGIAGEESVDLNGKRTAFDLLLLNNNIVRFGAFATKKNGEWETNLSVIEDVAIPAIEEAINNPAIKLILLDEVGDIQLKSDKFKLMLEKLYKSDKMKIVTVSYRSESSICKKLIEEADKYGRLFFLTEDRNTFVKNESELLSLIFSVVILANHNTETSPLNFVHGTKFIWTGLYRSLE